MAKRALILLWVLIFTLNGFSVAAQADAAVLNVPVKCKEGVTITPLNIRISDGSATNNRPGNGKVYVIVAFRLTNNGSKSYSFLKDLNLSVKQDGKVLDLISPYNVSLEIVETASAGHNYGILPAKEMAPGETIVGETGWIVDQNWKTLEITYSYQEFGPASAVFTFRRDSLFGAGSGLTTLYRSDFNRPGMDGWYGNLCSLSVIENGILMVTGRTSDWNGPSRIFSLKPGVEYTVSVNIMFPRRADPVTFMITVQQDGANWINLAVGEISWSSWTTLEGTFTPGPYSEYVLYVETLNAPNLDFCIYNFNIRGPKGGM